MEKVVIIFDIPNLDFYDTKRSDPKFSRAGGFLFPVQPSAACLFNIQGRILFNRFWLIKLRYVLNRLACGKGDPKALDYIPKLLKAS